MPDDRELVYWDSCVFLHYIEGDQAVLPTLDALLEKSASARGEITIVTSTVSIVEVAFAIHEKTGKALDGEVEARLDALWSDEQAVKLIEFHELIARDARDLMRRGLPFGRSLKPLDAVHLATGKRHFVSTFHTYDDRLYGYTNTLGFPIEAPVIPQPKLL